MFRSSSTSAIELFSFMTLASSSVAAETALYGSALRKLWQVCWIEAYCYPNITAPQHQWTTPPMDYEPQAQPAQTSMQDEAAAAARRLVRTALKASLATLDRETGHPYPSLVLVATEPDGSPILLISRLALHTRNLEKDGRARHPVRRHGRPRRSLGRRAGDRVRRGAADAIARRALRRFVARHASAQGYAAFPDFAAYTLTIGQGAFHRRVRPHRQPGGCRAHHAASTARRS